MSIAITFPTTFADTNVLTAAQLNGLQAAIQAYTIALSDMATQYGRFTMCFRHSGTMTAGTSKIFRFTVPTTDILVPVQVDLSFTSTAGAPVLSVQFTDDGANVQTATLTRNAAGSPSATTTSFAISSIAGGSAIIVTMSLITADVVDAECYIHFKTQLKA